MFFTCEYCGSKFSRELNFDKHFCENKKKHLLLKTKIGRSAFYFYAKWRKALGIPASEEKAFANSKYFKPFVNFVEYANQKLIPDKLGFINLMAKKRVDPSHWLMPEYYEFYIEIFDKLYTPFQQVEMSLEFLVSLAAALDCGIGDVVEEMDVIDLLKMVNAKKISPWLLLFMKSFQDYIKYILNPEQRLLVSTIINTEQWTKKIQANPEMVVKIKDLLKTLNL